MTLTRHAQGLRNKPKFHNVDVIVYVEGGSQGQAGAQPEQAIDVPFWRGIFNIYQPQLKVRFEPKGGKPNLRPLAEAIIANEVANNFVAFDADFDVLFENHIEHPQVLYTYGYSCENDLFVTEVLANVFFTLCHACDTDVDPRGDIQRIIADVKTDLRRAVRSDVLASIINETVIPRGGRAHLRLLPPPHNSPAPSIDQAAVKQEIQRLRRLREGKYYCRKKLDIDPHRHCYGHLIGSIFCFITRHLLRRAGYTETVSNHVIWSIGVRAFAEFLNTYPGSEIAEHYRVQFARLGAAH